MKKIYGRQKKKLQAKSDIVCIEPIRRSVYEILLENMQLLQRNIYVHRIIYIGTHTFPPGELEGIGRHFRLNIERVNATYNEEYLTGLLVHHTKHFIHVLDGSEDSIKKHLDMLFTEDKTKENLDIVKVLVVYHNINQRALPNWTEMSVKPPQLLQKIKSDIDVNEARSKILLCITKMYKMFETLSSHEENSSQIDAVPTTSSKAIQPIRLSESANPRSKYSIVDLKKSSRVSISRLQNIVPELQLMEFLIETSHTLDIQEFRRSYGSIPELYSFADACWPVETDFIPRNVFDTEYDPVMDMFDAIGSVDEETENF